MIRRPPLRIAVAQPLTAARDVAANALAHAAAVYSAGARVVVFPELSLTGYELDAPALDPSDPRLAPLVEACAATSTIALAGAPVREADGREYIAMLAVDGSGARVAYRKMYPGGAEAPRFAPGESPAALEVDGWRVGLAICRDTGIPEHPAATAALGIDVYAAGVLEFPADVDVPAERARRMAVEHGVSVAMASFAGSTGGGYANAPGRSGIWAADGSPVVRLGPEPGEVARATLTDDGGRG